MLKWKASILLGVVSLILFGCSNVENDNAQNHSKNAQQNETQPVRFDTQQEQNNIMDDSKDSVEYPKGEDTEYHTGDDNTDPYSNEEAVYIYNRLIKRDEILNAQVASTEDRIIVSVMLEPHFNLETKPDEEEIEGYIREIVSTTEKDIVVYTDNIEWDKRKNDNARLNDN